MVQQIENIPFIQLEAGSIPVKNSVEEVGMMQSCSTLHWWKFFFESHRWNLTAVATREPMTRLHLWTFHHYSAT